LKVVVRGDRGGPVGPQLTPSTYNHPYTISHAYIHVYMYVFKMLRERGEGVELCHDH